MNHELPPKSHPPNPPNSRGEQEFESIDLLLAFDFRPPSPPILGGECIQSPPELGDLGGIPGFMQEV
jgi:hypothetical protein